MACLSLQRGASAVDSFDLPGLLPHARADGLETSHQETLRLQATRDGEVRVWFALPESGRWDLSAVESVELEIHNPTDRPQLVRVSVENENAEQLRGKCSMAVLVAAGQTGKARVRIMPTPEAVDYSLFEPFMMYYKGIQVGDNTLNPSEIVRMVIEWPAARVGEALIVRRIGTVARADGGAGSKSVPFFLSLMNLGSIGTRTGREKFTVRLSFAKR